MLRYAQIMLSVSHFVQIRLARINIIKRAVMSKNVNLFNPVLAKSRGKNADKKTWQNLTR